MRPLFALALISACSPSCRPLPISPAPPLSAPSAAPATPPAPPVPPDDSDDYVHGLYTELDSAHRVGVAMTKDEQSVQVILELSLGTRPVTPDSGAP